MLVQSFIQAKQQANRRPSFEIKDCLYKKITVHLYHSREPKLRHQKKSKSTIIYTYLTHPPADGWT